VFAMSENYKEEFHDFYETAKRLVDNDLADFDSKIEYVNSSEERKFLMAVTSFFLQRHQEEIINKA
jgi:hypothetical protein